MERTTYVSQHYDLIRFAEGTQLLVHGWMATSTRPDPNLPVEVPWTDMDSLTRNTLGWTEPGLIQNSTAGSIYWRAIHWGTVPYDYSSFRQPSLEHVLARSGQDCPGACRYRYVIAHKLPDRMP